MAAEPLYPPLAGLRVVEADGEVATRYCGRLYSRLGASVVQVGDRSHDLVSHPGAAGRAYAAWLDEGKTTAADLATALASLKGAEGKSLVIGGQTPEAVRALDLALSQSSEAIIRIGVTWFGDAGAYAGWHGNDAVILALSGIAYGFGLPEGPPTLAQGHASQTLAGLNAFIGGLAALMAGEGGPSSVDVNVLESALCLTEPGIVAAQADPAVAISTRLGVNRFAPLYPATVYPTTDGHVGVTTLTPAQWTSLCTLIERPDMAGDLRFATSAERTLNADDIDEFLAPAIAKKSTDFWVEGGINMRVPITPAPRPRDLPKHPHWRDRGSFAPVADTGAVGPTLPYRFKFDGVTQARPVGGADGPMAGLRVADFSMGWAGPLAARYFADLGADVIKIESTDRPDWWRGWEIVEAQDPPLHELPRHFMAVNRSKRGVDIDLLKPEGKATAETIIKRSDVVIENHGPGVMAKLGLGQADQRRLHPGVISVSMPPFGFGGPLTGLRAYGSTVEHASGLPFVNGHEDWAPCMQHTAYGDPVAGIYAAASAMAALYGRDKLGGAEIDLCQVECIFQLGADSILADQLGGIKRTGSRRPAMAPVCVVATADPDSWLADKWLAVAIDSDAGWRALCGRLDNPLLSPDWRLAERKAHEDQIEAAIADWAKDLTAEDAAERLQAFGAAAAPVFAPDTLWRNDHLLQAGYWVTLDRRYIGEHIVPHNPISFDGARRPVTQPAPVLGQHSHEALSELTEHTGA